MEIEEDLVPGLKGQDRFWVGVMGTSAQRKTSLSKTAVTTVHPSAVQEGGLDICTSVYISSGLGPFTKNSPAL